MSAEIATLLRLSQQTLDVLQDTQGIPDVIKRMTSETAALNGILATLSTQMKSNTPEPWMIPSLVIVSCERTLNEIMTIAHISILPSCTGTYSLRFSHDAHDLNNLEHLKQELKRLKAAFSLVQSSYTSVQLLSARDVQTLQIVYEMLHILSVEQITRYQAELDPVLVLVEKWRRKLQPQLITPPLPPPEILKGDQRGEQKDMELSRYSAVKEAFRKRILKGIPGGESPLKPGMTRVRWTCVCNRKYYDDFYEVRPGAIQDMQKAMNAIYHTVQSPKSVHMSPTISRCSEVLNSFRLEGSNGGLAYTMSIEEITAAFSMNKVSTDEMVRGLFTVMIASVTIISLSVIAVFALMLVSINDPMLSPDDSKGAYGDSLQLPAHDCVPVERAPASQYPQAVVSGSGKGKQPSVEQSLDCGEGPSRRREFMRESMDIVDDTTRKDSSDDDSPGSNRLQRGQRHRDQIQQLWAIPLFLNSEREAIAVHVDVSERKTDYSLFRKFHQEYFTVSSGWQRFTQLHQVGKIQFVQFALTDYDRADVRRINVWPPKHDPQKWFYEPYPATEENIPLVGGQYLMNVWRDAHHADVAAYREYQRTAKWHHRLLHWLKHVIHRFFQGLRDFFSDGATPEASLAESNVLPPNIHGTDIEQPEKQPRSRHIVRSVPKTEGKISVSFRDDSPDAWGLRFKESFHVHRLLFFILLLFATVSLGVTIRLFRHYGLSGPSSVGSIISVVSWLLALFSLAVTVWCKWAENSPLD